MNRLLIVLMVLLLTVGCKTISDPSPYHRYLISDFDFKSANIFVRQIEGLTSINNISLTDLPKTGKEFRVNGQHIFTDSTFTNMPNFYSYKKRAAEIDVNPTTLLQVLNSFFGINADSYRKEEGFYMFTSESYLSYEKGYIYNATQHFKVGDSIFKGRTYYITRQVDSTWFEYKYP
ncbi:hypothetical protein [Flavobacterium subsaxonicum]|nr:hypothetical protein [Flavobacterium subsaxonicum]